MKKIFSLQWICSFVGAPPNSLDPEKLDHTDIPSLFGLIRCIPQNHPHDMLPTVSSSLLKGRASVDKLRAPVLLSNSSRVATPVKMNCCSNELSISMNDCGPQVTK
ncbi:hypothetical protein CSKR_201086 [Clonorchis sinensis]|uniref:Uncharacterized protein n=1 Tax=Clonorchis sinensis TaxID=79923 RepID=A0A8T1MLC8_CLOSI|nr:hypothetical protein CSKR_201086 [Clonorchis sinensis]